jgi:hypothetical protein
LTPALELVEERRELLQDGIDMALDGPQGMIGGDNGIEVDHGQEVRLGLRDSTHVTQTRKSMLCSNILPFFNSLLERNSRRFTLQNFDIFKPGRLPNPKFDGQFAIKFIGSVFIGAW